MVRAKSSAFVALAAGVVLAAGQASGAAPVRVSLVRDQLDPIAGRGWTAELRVRPSSFKGAVRVTASGPKRFAVRAAGGRGSYHARLVFPVAGRWRLTASAGASTSRLGSVLVRKPAPTPLTFVWPTSIDVEPDGALLLVENGLTRVLRIDAATGRETTIASAIPKAYAVARAPSGSIFVSGAHVLLRLDGTGAPVVVAEAEADIGPIAVGSNGDVYFSTETQIFRLSAGGGPPVLVTGTSARLGRPHGLAVAGDGALLVSDTDNNRLLRIDAATGAVTTLAQVGTPDGIDVATDGTIYVVDARSKRVVHLSATGEPLGFAGPAFANPYDVEVGPGGVVYVVDTAVSGRVLRVAPDGTVTTLSHRP